MLVNLLSLSLYGLRFYKLCHFNITVLLVRLRCVNFTITSVLFKSVYITVTLQLLDLHNTNEMVFAVYPT